MTPIDCPSRLVSACSLSPSVLSHPPTLSLSLSLSLSTNCCSRLFQSFLASHRPTTVSPPRHSPLVPLWPPSHRRSRAASLRSLGPHRQAMHHSGMSPRLRGTRSPLGPYGGGGTVAAIGVGGEEPLSPSDVQIDDPEPAARPAVQKSPVCAPRLLVFQLPLRPGTEAAIAHGKQTARGKYVRTPGRGGIHFL